MSEDVAGGPPRSPLQQALLTSDTAWRWWLLGYEAGCASGYNVGVNSAFGVLAEHAPYKDAGALMASTMNPANGLREVRFRANRAAMLATEEPTETLTERHARVAASWGLPCEGAA